MWWTGEEDDRLAAWAEARQRQRVDHETRRLIDGWALFFWLVIILDVAAALILVGVAP